MLRNVLTGEIGVRKGWRMRSPFWRAVDWFWGLLGWIVDGVVGGLEGGGG